MIKFTFNFNLSRIYLKFFLSILFTFICLNILGQIDNNIDLKKFDYKKADSIAINFPKKKYKAVTEIVGPLTEKLTTEHEKFRAIFRWITENIEYNKSAASASEADKIIRKNKAVCQGFSNLLKEMCNSVNIDCDVIVGYTKTEPKDINKKLKKTDHAWNSVKLYDKWYLVDVTWATSKYNVTAKKFVKEFDEHYFLTPADRFILDHFPQDKKYQFLPKPIKAKKFIATPLYYADYFHLNIDNVIPTKGEFSQKQSKPFEFIVETKTPITKAAVLLNYDVYVTSVDIKPIEGKPNFYTFSFNFPKDGLNDITIYLNGVCIVEYLVHTK